ncbi:serine-protein kinase ATM [Hyla sarda]|uniref:serine-protein kinase ATM n=1 Tax=Hyla sarda TaxID=327740 RepID=UPI0024C42DBC|nr:serine-protein kinase ATM [Hyla sarda]XP_056417622.1 serine-protein kinase ATM [Hyla sarda]XP_056417623.1 serine-protein kinase ATM [Hyla sarda]XP_056417624.1 serine-protein kinase ATM [Hyla sarda]XP_056417625.1 serine-protein kinase ATM [Hyla sarda]XP_056417626.1 serine-protein kinase ATM [Hyla sarda]XP_056417627.1 serine-protein kinase ATM [Hyla sarda]XP_056417628.1 serine-protein kinase ATM [Hyla sarda]XP_056417629.1 serine-protein kinase ATM [Hyla sarda]XP_056417630.1 serine-protein
MSLALHELLLCCRQLENDKATERRKEIDKFRRLLRDQETVQQLDRNSDARHGKQLNWDTVFRFLQKYIFKETESIKSAKANVSQSTQATRQKKMQEISSLVKYFIRCANKRAPRLKCAELLHHVMDTVKDPTKCAAYGTDYSSILLKDILTVRKYWCEITPQQWADLWSIYSNLYLKPNSTINRLLVARIIQTLTRGCCLQTEEMHSKFFNFFSVVIHRVREERNLPGLDQIFAALNTFLPMASLNCRMRVCKLGEDVFPIVLRLWTQQRPKDALKEEIVEFFRLMVHVHHPRGAKTVEEGAYAFDGDKWQRNLYNLYDALMGEITQIGSRGKYSSGSRNIAVNENLVELMADICHQLFTEETRVLEITQASFAMTQRDPLGNGAPSKRRRIELGWEVVRDKIQRSKNDFDVIPWLQIAACLIARHPMSLPCSELTPILTILHQLLAEQRRGEKAMFVLKCLKELAICQKQKTDVTVTPKSDLQKLWTKIWALTLRSLSSPQTEADSFALLGVILQGGLVPVDRDFWKIFSGSAGKPSSSAVQCLCLALTSGIAPDHLTSHLELPLHEGNGGKRLLKEEIIKWLLFGHLDDEMEDINEHTPLVNQYFFQPSFQKSIVSLTMKNSSAAMDYFGSFLECSHQKIGSESPGFSETEELFLASSFNEITMLSSASDSAACQKAGPTCPTVHQCVRKRLELDLLAVSEQLLNSYSSETTPPDSLVQCACLLTGVLACYCHAEVISEDEACQSSLFQKAKMLMQCVAESTSILKGKLSEEPKIVLLGALISQCLNCVCNCPKEGPARFSADLFLRLITPRMLTDLCDICRHLVSSNGTIAETIDGDTMDTDREARMDIEDQGDADFFDDHSSTEATESIESGELQNITGAVSPLSEEHVTKPEMVLSQTLQFLCFSASPAIHHNVNFRPSDIRRRILNIFDNTLDTSKPLHLRVFLQLLNDLPVKALPVEDMNILLKSLPDVCSAYRRDQEVCTAILRSLLPIVRCLGQEEEDTEETSDAEGQLLNVIYAFWKLTKDGKYTAMVRVALVNCMKTLIEVDPQSKWAILTVRDTDLSVRDAFSEFLADTHQQVRMLAAQAANRLFQDVKLQALPLKLQQKAFENVYMKAQEGMSQLSRSCQDPEDLPDEKCNRNSTLLMLVSVILFSSPVCEKQALFAICQSVKQNNLDPQHIRKVLEKVSTTLGYRNMKDFMTSHLDYLVLEWLRMKVPEYTLSTFPYTLLDYPTLRDFYRSCYKVLIPPLIMRNDLDEIKSMAQCIEEDWKVLLADCFPRILVNILPYFASECSSDAEKTNREDATKVYDLLRDDSCLGTQQIDNLFQRNLPEIVVELLMTLHETPCDGEQNQRDILQYTRELDPAPNPPYFPSSVIKATLNYISSCHKNKQKSLIAILSKTPDAFQKILLSICRQAAESNNIHKKHRILIIYHLFVNLLLQEIKDGLGGAWAFVLRDVIYNLIHHINSRVACPTNEVCTRSTMLCLDLLHRVCGAAVTYCNDALENHLHVIVGSLIPLANCQDEIQRQVCDLLTFLVIESKDNENLYHTIKLLDPFPDHPVFKNLRQTHQKIKYSKGAFSLIEEINHFLSVSVCDSLPLTRLEGLNDLRKQLQQHKDEMKDIVRDFQVNPQNNVIPKLVMSLLELSKNAADLDNGKDVLEAVGSCLGELGPIDFCTIALKHRKELLYGRAGDIFEDKELQCVLVILALINNALTDHCIHVRSAAATCLKNILATKTGCHFWDSYKDHGDPMLVYLQPFRTPKKKVLQVEPMETEGAFDIVDDHSLWIPQNGSHEDWIKNLTCALLDSGGVRSEVLLLLKPMCEVKADFCQAVLPYLIHNILLCDPKNTWRTLLSKHIKGFFTACCRSTPTSSRSATPASSDSESESLAQGTVNMASRRTMLSIVEYLRKQRRPDQGTAFDDNFWLDLNYLEVAMAVQSCAAHFTALLYTEIYVDKIKLDGEQTAKSKFTARKSLKFEEESQTVTIVSISEKSKEETGISLQALMMDIYRSIGEPDSLYGCGGGKMLHPLARIRTYEHEAKWGKALVTYDLETNLPPAARQAGIMQALQNFGLSHMLSTYLRGLEHENPEWSSEVQEIRYQAAWRNMQWEQSPSHKNDAAGPGYHESLYCALQSLRDKEFPTFYDHIKFARVKEVEELCKGSLESVYSLYPTLCRLQAIGELANAGQMFSRSIPENLINDLYMKWQQQSQLLKDSDFGFQEPVLALRSVILETMLEKNVSSQDCLNEILTRHLVELSQVARLANNTQLPEKAMFQIKQHNSAQFLVSEWQLEEAQVFWAKKEQSLALSLLRQMVDKLEAHSFEVENDPSLQLIYVECLRLCGNWLAETCLESPTIIMQNFLEKAVEVAESYSTGSGERLQQGRMKAFLSLARFSDAQYQRIDNYMKSSEFENKQALLAKAKEEVELMRQHKVQTNRYTIKVQRELELDECAISALKEDRKHFLCTAIRNYISCLVSGEEHDMWIFRLCSLWLENSGLPEVNSIMKKDSQKIPSHKFLPLMYQLAARMGTKKMGRQDFHEVLNNVISQTSLAHPYHTLFIILALANANKDDLLLKSEVVKRGRLTKNAPKKISQTDEDRMEAACNIVNTIKKHRPLMVRDVERLCDAYIILANMDANQWKSQRKGIPIPPDQPITKLKNLQDVVIPTMELKVDPSGKYENLVTIASFKPEFRLAGGLNLPKIIDCVGSDGKERRQLVKGRDDLRQDAVMQQVFQMCNTLLQRDSETRKRKLSIRRYKVVPLSQRSGVLEWCSGTVPIGEYLVNGDDGAHKRYRPGDYSSLQCQKKLLDVQRARFEDKYQVFLDISEHFRPVFRYFCMEKFLDPAIWFEKRLAYTRSVATSSIVGYIVGLGDRHVQNILIDEQTAELVHIDLGVAFEQGKILPTPETVPFRLTRDIVDGMGITGVEGVFRRCCEKTMEVMRSSQDALLTIVEVLLYDPLFDWTMNPLKALYLQQDEAELNATLPDDPECNRNSCNDTQSFNKVAERVLLRLQEKLKGVEEGTVLNAEGQVNLLIQQAMDPKNLSRLFPGWKAWV